MTSSARPPRNSVQPQPTQSRVPPVANPDNSPGAVPQSAPPPPITATRMPDPAAQLAPKPPTAPIDDNLRLALRLVIGVVTEGGDMTLRTLRELQKEIDDHPEALFSTRSDRPEQRRDILRFLAIGALLAAQQRTAQGVESGLRLSARTTGWFFGTLDRTTDNALLRPFRKPVDQLWLNVNQTLEDWVRQGRIEEANGRLIFDGAVGDVIDSVIENVSQAEELAQLVRDQIAQQSGTVASAAVNTGRTATVAADNVMEGLIRRLFRRTPRTELPASPLAGKPQTMYDTEERVGLERSMGLE